MLEKDTNAKIIIRGKGSIKENKIGRKDGQPLPGEDEPLHAYITGPTVDVVNKACQKVREIVKQGIEVPETMNDLRRNQLRELALLNGTLRENDSLNKLKILAQAQTIVTNTIICSLCGSAGHITSDCKHLFYFIYVRFFSLPSEKRDFFKDWKVKARFFSPGRAKCIKNIRSFTIF